MKLILKNLKGRPVRSIMMLLLSLIMSLAVMAGTLLMTATKKGIQSTEERLGADIMVISYEASTKSSVSDLTLQGNPGAYYMKRSVLTDIKTSEKIEGIDKISEQYVLSTIAASCCDSKVTIFGFDPETDFTISPWIHTSYNNSLDLMDIVVGSDLSISEGDTFRCYGSTLNVVAKMDSTGTYLDQSVYASIDTIKEIVAYATENQIYSFTYNPTNYISSILINVKSGYTPEEVKNSIKIYTKGTAAISQTEMVSSISKNLSGVSGMIGGLMGVIWAVCFLSLAVTHVMMINERKKEFAIMRAIGASKGHVIKVVWEESTILCLGGGILGTGLGLLITILFRSTMSDLIALPMIMPQTGIIILLVFTSLFFSLITGIISSLFALKGINNTDPAMILREDN